jgi:hypothetical protein
MMGFRGSGVQAFRRSGVQGFRCSAGARLLPFALLILLLLQGCHSSSAGRSDADHPLILKDVAAEAGLRFHHTTGASGRFYMPETLGSGCAFLDYDRDGRPDIFLVNSDLLPGAARRGTKPTQALFHNRGDGGAGGAGPVPGAAEPWSCTFEDVTRKAGLAVEMYGMGCAAADYDNDGYPDLYVSALGPDRLFHNNGDGTFTDVTKRAGIDAPEWNTSVVWFDYDRDGRLDLYVCGYCRWTPATNRDCPDSQGHRHMCTPESYPGVSSRLYHNNGKGTFTDVTAKAGVRVPSGKALAALEWDANDDGWPDLLVANDLEPNLLFLNQKDGTFREAGAEVGIAFSSAGKARAGMGLDTGDLFGSGHEGVLIGNFSAEGLGLYAAAPPGPPNAGGDGRPSSPNAGGEAGRSPPPALGGPGGAFTDIADAAGLAPASLRSLTFAALFCDFDLDGQPDILTANGHIDPNAELTGRGVTYRQRLQLFRQENGRFRDVTAEAGPGLQRPGVYRGLAVADFDGDGDPDVLVSENGGSPLLLRNESRGSHWLQVRLQGTKSNRDGIGARVRVTAAGLTQTRWVRAGSGYCSSSDPRALFGLGPASEAERLEIRWPSGETQTLPHIRADQVARVVEGGKPTD